MKDKMKYIKMFFNEVKFAKTEQEMMNKQLAEKRAMEENDRLEREAQSEKLTISQIALKLVYENVHVTRENATDIIKKYDLRSGDALYNKYTFYVNNIDRKAKPDPYSKVKLKNKIKLFESVIELLQDEFKGRAIDELNILKNYYKIDFSE